MNSEHHHGLGEEAKNSHLIQKGSLIEFLLYWTLDYIFKISDIFRPQIRFQVRLGLFLVTLIIAIYLIKRSHDVVFDVEKSSVITTGVYAYVRHPMYLGTLFFYLSLIFSTMSLIALFPFIIIIFLYNILAVYEERDLERILGQEYVDYKNRVARWIPKIY